ncbi:hypothetical protein, partial [Pseudonocardia sp. NPDC046786]|uniref:hypothetical protein n=1 Tax=Pseudonocardia sp. NPDC046786 TaxID=3155471 RepID=UPI0033F07D09
MTAVIDAPASPDPPAGPVRPAGSDPSAGSDPPAAADLSAVPDLYAVRARFEQLAAVVDEVSPSPVLVDRMIALVAV